MMEQFSQAGRELDLYEVSPDTRFTLDATAHLAGVSRRSLLLYCRAGLVQPRYEPPYGMMVFTEEAIYAARRVEEVRTTHGVSVTWLKRMFDLAGEVDRLRTELRFHRNR